MFPNSTPRSQTGRLIVLPLPVESEIGYDRKKGKFARDNTEFPRPSPSQK